MDLNDIYTEVILEQSRNKRNRRDINDPTKTELGHNPSCGDEITIKLKIKNGKIEDMAYSGQGCAISQASTSIMIDTVKGLEISEALNQCENFISMIRGENLNEDEMEKLQDAVIFENMKNLPARVKCAALPWHTLKNILKK